MSPSRAVSLFVREELVNYKSLLQDTSARGTSTAHTALSAAMVQNIHNQALINVKMIFPKLVKTVFTRDSSTGRYR